MKNYINIERITKLSKVDAKVPLYQKIIKLSEEAGEISDALDIMANEIDIINVVEEACDTINVAVDIINVLNSSNEFGENLYHINMTNDILFNNVKAFSIFQLVNRISSEVGKSSQAFLRFDGAKNVSKSAVEGKEALLKQINNVIIWCDIVIRQIEKEYVGVTPDFIVKLFNSKLDKWESKQNKYKGNL